MSIHFDDVRRESEKTYFFVPLGQCGELRKFLDADGIEYQCYTSRDFKKVLPEGMEIPPVLMDPIPELGLTAVAPYRTLRVIISNLNTDDLMQKLIRIMRGSDQPEDYRCHISDYWRDQFNDPHFYKEITKNAVIPVAKSDVEMMEALLASAMEADELLPFEEDGFEEDEPLPFEEYDDETLPFVEDDE